MILQMKSCLILKKSETGTARVAKVRSKVAKVAAAAAVVTAESDEDSYALEFRARALA